MADQGGTTTSSIFVAVRVRPLSENEQASLQPEEDDFHTFHTSGTLGVTPHRQGGALRKVVQVPDDKMLVFDPPSSNEAPYDLRRTDTRLRRHKDIKFTFDKVFEENASQEEVYASTTRDLLNGILEGYNSTVFAYGATGCGKTHTIRYASLW
jgi:kinesin family protein 18/19